MFQAFNMTGGTIERDGRTECAPTKFSGDMIEMARTPKGRPYIFYGNVIELRGDTPLFLRPDLNFFLDKSEEIMYS